MEQPTAIRETRIRSSDSTSAPSSSSAATTALVINTDSSIFRTASSDSPTETDNDQTSSSSSSSPEYEVEDLSKINSNSKEPSPNKLKIQRRPSNHGSFPTIKEDVGKQQKQQQQQQEKNQKSKPAAPSSSSGGSTWRQRASEAGIDDCPVYSPPPPPTFDALPRTNSPISRTQQSTEQSSSIDQQESPTNITNSSSHRKVSSSSISTSSTGIISNIDSPLLSGQSSQIARTLSCDEDASTININRPAHQSSGAQLAANQPKGEAESDAHGSSASYSDVSVCQSLGELDELDLVLVQRSDGDPTNSNSRNVTLDDDDSDGDVEGEDDSTDSDNAPAHQVESNSVAVSNPIESTSSAYSDTAEDVPMVTDSILDDDIWRPAENPVDYNSDFESIQSHPSSIEAFWADLADDEDVTVDDVSLSSQLRDLPILEDDTWNEEPLPDTPDLDAAQILDSNYTPVSKAPAAMASVETEGDMVATPNAAMTLAALLASYSPEPPSPTPDPAPVSIPTPAKQASSSDTSNTKSNIASSSRSQPRSSSAFVLPTLAMPTPGPGAGDEEMTIDDMITQIAWRPTKVAIDGESAVASPSIGQDTDSVMRAWKAADEQASRGGGEGADAFAMRSQLGVWSDEGYLPEEELYVQTRSDIVTMNATAPVTVAAVPAISQAKITAATKAKASGQSLAVDVPQQVATSTGESRAPVVILIGPKGSDAQLIQHILSPLQQTRNSRSDHTRTCVIGKDLPVSSLPSGCATMPLERDIIAMFQSKLVNPKGQPFDSVVLSLCGIASATKHIGSLLHTLRQSSVINAAFRVCSVTTVFDYGQKQKKATNDFAYLTSPMYLRLQKRGVSLPSNTARVLDKFQKFKDYLALSDLLFVTNSLPHEEVVQGMSVDEWTEILETEAQSINPFLHVHSVVGQSGAQSTSAAVFPRELLFELDAYEHENYSNFDFDALPITFRPHIAAAATSASVEVQSAVPSINSSFKVVENSTSALKPAVPSGLGRVVRQSVNMDRSPLSTPRGQSSPSQHDRVTGANSALTNDTSSFVSVAVTIFGDMDVSVFNAVMNPFFIENARQNKLLKCYGYLAFDRTAQGESDKFVFIGAQTHLVLQRTRSVFSPEEERCSRLVFVGKNLDVDLLVFNLRTCVLDPKTRLAVKVART